MAAIVVGKPEVEGVGELLDQLGSIPGFASIDTVVLDNTSDAEAAARLAEVIAVRRRAGVRCYLMNAEAQVVDAAHGLFGEPFPPS